MKKKNKHFKRACIIAAPVLAAVIILGVVVMGFDGGSGLISLAQALSGGAIQSGSALETAPLANPSAQSGSGVSSGPAVWNGYYDNNENYNDYDAPEKTEYEAAREEYYNTAKEYLYVMTSPEDGSFFYASSFADAAQMIYSGWEYAGLARYAE